MFSSAILIFRSFLGIENTTEFLFVRTASDVRHLVAIGEKLATLGSCCRAVGSNFDIAGSDPPGSNLLRAIQRIQSDSTGRVRTMPSQPPARPIGNDQPTGLR
jgi:hypothetical protein